jgi:hypothetical protein
MDSGLKISPLMALERVNVMLPSDRVSIGWLYGAFDTQATFLLILMFGLLGALPAASLPAGLAICVLSLRLVMPRGMPHLPALIASRRVKTPAARYAIGKAIALLRLCDRLVMPSSESTALNALRPATGVLLFLLGASLLVPIPFSNVLPSLAAAAIALALIEGSVALFLLGVVGAIGGLSLVSVAGLAALRAVAGV